MASTYWENYWLDKYFKMRRYSRENWEKVRENKEFEKEFDKVCQKLLKYGWKYRD